MDLLDARGEKVLTAVSTTSTGVTYSLLLFRQPWTTVSFPEHPTIWNLNKYVLYSIEKQREYVRETLKRNSYIERIFSSTMDYLAWLWTDLEHCRSYSVATWKFQSINFEELSQLTGVCYFRAIVNNQYEKFLLDINTEETVFYSSALSSEKLYSRSYSRDLWLNLGDLAINTLFMEKLSTEVIVTGLRFARIF